jgi:hypothetical protein
MAGISDDIENLRVNRSDFMQAFDEVHPAFGVSEEELQQVVQNGIIHYDKQIDVRPITVSSLHQLTNPKFHRLCCATARSSSSK